MNPQPERGADLASPASVIPRPRADGVLAGWSTPGVTGVAVPTDPSPDPPADRSGTSSERQARAWLSRVVEPGDAETFTMVRKHGAVATVEHIVAGTVSSALRERTEGRQAAADASADLTRAAELGIRFIVPTDEEWPTAALHPLEVATASGHRRLIPPLGLWVRGERLDSLLGRCVAIIGARASTAYGEHVALDFSEQLAARGWTIVSGGAYGIDSFAHRGALAADGRTAAVLACGLDRPYPLAHEGLFDRLAAHGALISEWPLGATPQRHRFLVRNRLIAAVAAGTVVVEAAARSGTSATARQVVNLGRSLMAVPGPIISSLSVGTHELVRTLGAQLVTRVDEVVEEIGLIGTDLAQPRTGEVRPRDSLGPTAQQVLDGFPVRGEASPETIAIAAGVAVREVLRVLPGLELAGFVEASGGGWRLTRCARTRDG